MRKLIGFRVKSLVGAGKGEWWRKRFDGYTDHESAASIYQVREIRSSVSMQLILRNREAVIKPVYKDLAE